LILICIAIQTEGIPFEVGLWINANFEELCGLESQLAFFKSLIGLQVLREYFQDLF
jgi:hypothetical protein